MDQFIQDSGTILVMGVTYHLMVMEVIQVIQVMQVMDQQHLALSGNLHSTIAPTLWNSLDTALR